MHIATATAAEAPALSAILFRAFANDRLLVGTCYPDTPANRAWWAQRIATHMADPNTKVLKVVLDEGDGNAGAVAGWAKWLVHRPAEAADEGKHGAVDPDAAPSPDMDLEACRTLAQGQYAMRERIFGKGRDMKSHWWLNAIVVDPTHQRRGVADLLIQHGCNMADQDGDGLDIFSACTTQANQNMSKIWKKYGIEVVDNERVTGDLGVFAGHRKASRKVGV